MTANATTHAARLLTAALLATTTAAGAALAQTNPTASQLINELKPTGMLSDTTRGITPLNQDSNPPMAPMAPMSGMAQPAAIRAPMSYAAPAPAPVPDMAAPSANLSVDFSSGSANLTPGAMATLDQLGKALSSPQLAAYNFKIAGHTDTVGDAATNQTLSEQRAASVKSYLEAKFGIADTRLQAVGLGESDPVVPTPPQTPSQANRRVQIINLGQ